MNSNSIVLVRCARCGADCLDTEGLKSLCADCYWETRPSETVCRCGGAGFLRCCGRERCWDCARKHRATEVCVDQEAEAEAAGDRVDGVERDFGPDR